MNTGASAALVIAGAVAVSAAGFGVGYVTGTPTTTLSGKPPPLELPDPAAVVSNAGALPGPGRTPRLVPAPRTTTTFQDEGGQGGGSPTVSPAPTTAPPPIVPPRTTTAPPPIVPPRTTTTIQDP